MVRGASSDVPHGVLHYGTTQPFDVSEVKAKERNKYLPLHLQEVRDEQGRKRLHGAFTGGFSAGYYNTVGSKEGWQPSSFVSSRKNKQKYVHNPEMYMDEEDLEDHKGQIRISSEYSSEQSSLEQKSKQSSVQIESTPATELFASIALDIIYPTESTLQSKLLVKNGWKMNINLSNPDYERLMSKVSKNRNGLGYKNDDLFCKDSSYGNSLGRPVKKSANRMDFAVFDDNEDDNIFGTFSKSKYNTCIGGVSQSESSHEGSSSYDSKSSSRNSNINAISGFTAGSMITTSFNLYSRVNVPPEYVPSVPSSLDLKGYGKKSKKYTIEERREILSEKPSNLKRSVFSYLSIKSQNQLADYIENAEKCRRIRKQFSDNVSNANISIVPKTSVNKEVALAALQGFIPFSNDLNKRERYKKFLLAHAEDKMYFVSKLEGLSEQELQHEQNEFTKAALMFRPMGVNMASKFASAKSPDVCTLPKRSVVEIPDKITPEYKKIGESPKEVIVDVPDEGLKRVVKPFFPVKLLSKRFGLPPITPPSDVEQYKNQAANPMFSFSQIKSDMDHENQKTGKFSAINEHEKLEIKEPEKPSLEIFKAIFSDSGSDTEEPERPSKKPQDLLQSKVKPSFDRQNEENYTPNKKVKVAQSDFRPIFRSRKYRDKN